MKHATSMLAAGAAALLTGCALLVRAKRSAVAATDVRSQLVSFWEALKGVALSRSDAFTTYPAFLKDYEQAITFLVRRPVVADDTIVKWSDIANQYARAMSVPEFQLPGGAPHG
jgi:hypothetical protein